MTANVLLTKLVGLGVTTREWTRPSRLIKARKGFAGTDRDEIRAAVTRLGDSSATLIAAQFACNGLWWSQTKEVKMPKHYMGNENSTDVESKPEQAAEPTPEVIAPEDEVHPHIDAETPHVDPTGVADFDRPYDQWSNDDLKVRARQLGVVGVYGHGELIDMIREAELRLEKQEAATVETS